MSEIPESAPPGPPLDPADIEELAGATLDAYRKPQLLVRRVYHKWGIRLGDVIYLSQANSAIVDELLDWAEERGRTRELLGLLWSGNPGNPKLAAIGQRLLGPLEPIAARYDIGREQSIAAAPVPVTRDSLEKIVTERSRLQDFGAFVARLDRIGKAVCRVETATSMGTGFLVGRQTVLTNYHVVKGAVETGAPGDQICCRFDFVRAAGGGEIPGVPVRAAGGNAWLAASSPFSQSDVTGDGEPGPDELDFALIRLSAPVEETRLPLAIDGSPPIVAPMDIAIIVQHPDGDPLTLAMGKVLEFPASGLRYRYNATTKGGSSGAPVFSADFDLIGLHHAADTALSPRFNQAVPIWRVAAAVAQAGLSPGGL